MTVLRFKTAEEAVAALGGKIVIPGGAEPVAKPAPTPAPSTRTKAADGPVPPRRHGSGAGSFQFQPTEPVKEAARRWHGRAPAQPRRFDVVAAWFFLAVVVASTLGLFGTVALKIGFEAGVAQTITTNMDAVEDGRQEQ